MHSTMKLQDCSSDCYQKFTNPYRIKDENLRANNSHLSEEVLDKLANYGLICFRYNFAVFTTNWQEIGLETRSN